MKPSMTLALDAEGQGELLISGTGIEGRGKGRNTSCDHSNHLVYFISSEQPLYLDDFVFIL